MDGQPNGCGGRLACVSSPGIPPCRDAACGEAGVMQPGAARCIQPGGRRMSNGMFARAVPCVEAGFAFGKVPNGNMGGVGR
jgi:hypothetical protein